jgi:hypothetical protein
MMLQEIVARCIPPHLPVRFIALADGLVCEVDTDSLFYAQDLLLELLPRHSWVLESTDKELLIDIPAQTLRMIATR